MRPGEPNRAARPTGQAVRTVFSSLDGFHSIRDVHARLCAAGDAVGLTTVYRAVQPLAEDGELDSIRTDSGETLYRRGGHLLPHGGDLRQVRRLRPDLATGR
jgi:Fe2+ or Zn2+ uptake regulation protein